MSMKKLILIIPAIFLFFDTLSAQTIKYENSLEEAKKLSQEQNKPLAILITIQPPAYVSNPLQILEDKNVVAKFNGSFINFKIDRADTLSKSIINEYHISFFPSFVFIDSKGGLMFKDTGGPPVPQRFISMADRAIAMSKEKSLIDFDEEYKAGNYTLAFLKEYITKRAQRGITDNAALIEKYVDFLTVADLNNYNQVLFILRSGPTVDSKAYRLAYTNKKIIDSIFKKEPLEARTFINNVIISNTMAEAIATKNVTKANAAANFTRNTWTGTDIMQGQKNASLKMLQYFTAIKDTSSYLRQAGSFYDRYYMNISADSLRRLDEKNMEKAKNAALERATLNIPQGGALQSFSFTYATANYGIQLNNGAWSFYLTGTKNPTYLMKAILWSKRSIELSPTISAYYDTLAHLLYRMEFYAEAESMEKKAIELGKEEKRDINGFEIELVKIQNKSL
jgi:hypothetical protein